MGFDFAKVGYLWFSAQAGLGQGDLSKIEVLGEKVADHIRKYRPHDKVERQYRWIEGPEVTWPKARRYAESRDSSGRQSATLNVSRGERQGPSALRRPRPGPKKGPGRRRPCALLTSLGYAPEGTLAEAPLAESCRLLFLLAPRGLAACKQAHEHAHWQPKHLFHEQPRSFLITEPPDGLSPFWDALDCAAPLLGVLQPDLFSRE